MRIAESQGAYRAERAASLSGVPWSTVHYWARKEILVPSVSATKIKLWSYTDLMGLRTIYWLRRRKVTREGWDIPPTTMITVRNALESLARLDLDLWTEDGRPSVQVDAHGEIHIMTAAGPESLSGARPLDPDMLDLIAPFEETRLIRGPDLQAPRPNLRIVPGKLSGSPHIAHTRIETIAIAALANRGYDSAKIEKLYANIGPPIAFREAVDLERQLSENLRAAA